MEQNYVLLTDDSCDLPLEYLEQHQVPYISLSFRIDAKQYTRNDMPLTNFYSAMRSGKIPATAQVNIQSFLDFFKPHLIQGKNILYLAFSSGLSGTCASAQAAAEELAQEFTQQKIVVIDTLCASLGQGLLVYKAVEQYENGIAIDELTQYITELIPHVAHIFTVDDLVYLHRGGRVSKAAMIAGTILGIKPYLGVDDEGHLIPIGKVRGRKAALEKLVQQMKIQVGKTSNAIFMISHGDCMEDAEYVKQRVIQEFGIAESLISYVGPVIGAHSGPGTVALFMIAEKRMPN